MKQPAVYAMYLARERDAQRWVCPDQMLLNQEQIEAVLSDRQIVRSRACRQFGFCTGSVFVKIVEVGSWWDPSQHGRVDRAFFRDERLQVHDTHEFKALDSTPSRPADAPSGAVEHQCGHKRHVPASGG